MIVVTSTCQVVGQLNNINFQSRYHMVLICEWGVRCCLSSARAGITLGMDKKKSVHSIEETVGHVQKSKEGPLVSIGCTWVAGPWFTVDVGGALWGQGTGYNNYR